MYCATVTLCRENGGKDDKFIFLWAGSFAQFRRVNGSQEEDEFDLLPARDCEREFPIDQPKPVTEPCDKILLLESRTGLELLKQNVHCISEKREQVLDHGRRPSTNAHRLKIEFHKPHKGRYTDA